MLRAWMADNKSKSEALDLILFNSKKNSSFHRTTWRSLYIALFGNNLKIGLSTSNLQSDLMKKLTTEEDLKYVSQIKEIKNTQFPAAFIKLKCICYYQILLTIMKFFANSSKKYKFNMDLDMMVKLNPGIIKI